jgi:hypothetical protein
MSWFDSFNSGSSKVIINITVHGKLNGQAQSSMGRVRR